MKIVIKHIDNLRSSINNKDTIPEYLVYVMTNDDIAVSCINTCGDIFMNAAVKDSQAKYGNDLPVHIISYEEHQNNIKQIEENYVRN